MKVPHIIVAEFLDEITQRAEDEFKGQSHQAFLDWYIEAEFGKVQWQFTDDANDGGIDAIVWLRDDDPGVAIIQSKYTAAIGRQKLNGRAYKDFSDVVKAFKHGGDEFDEFLKTVRSDLRGIYRKAHHVLEQSDNWFHKKKAFRIITTCKGRPSSYFDQIPKDNFLDVEDVFKLYSSYRQAQTPRSRNLQLRVEDKLSYRDSSRGMESYAFNAYVYDFRKYLEINDVGRLVARNIRYNLGGKLASKIVDTYQKHPRDFWYFHNGLTLICDDFEERQGRAILTAPSVINGAQTLYAINTAPTTNSPARVAVRVIVREKTADKRLEDEKWYQDVIENVNTQNKVQPFDLRSNDPQQIALQKRFRDVKVYFERKRGEWREVRNEPKYRGFERINLKTMGQILTASSSGDGEGVLAVKKGSSFVFSSDNYKRIFPNRKLTESEFSRIYLAYRVCRFLRQFGYANAKTLRKQQHGFWNCLWLLTSGIEHGLSGRKLSAFGVKAAFKSLEGRGADGGQARDTARRLTKSAWASWRSVRREDPERWTANNYFKSKMGNRKLRLNVAPKFSVALKSISRVITKTRSV